MVTPQNEMGQKVDYLGFCQWLKSKHVEKNILTFNTEGSINVQPRLLPSYLLRKMYLWRYIRFGKF